MASLFYLREEMQRAFEIMDDKSYDFETRRAARARFHHCVVRVGTMERGGATEDDPGHFLRGYSEEGFSSSPKSHISEAPSDKGKALRRQYIDRKSEVQIAGRERL